MSTVAFSQTATQNYIDENKDLAVELMNTYHIPASIILGVAIHESGSGTSKIARYLNNHFGIKGSNSSTKIRSAYKGYDEGKDSYQDFINIMQNRSKFAVLFDKYNEYDYRSWAKGIQRGGYAASRTWASQVIAIINYYNLYLLDNRPEGYVEPPTTVVTSTTYKVRSGDTLGRIAERYHTTVKNLMKKNHLKSTVLQIGQKLKI
ncbi:MAG: glucosaminidase domain-containing protein [Bacteroidetes bacterium]|nr:glucosaminidase domain-containing protein [Bacteroidota bacterium]MBU1371723.1 glucosaminidase domain-containing protein [Bacteroidota bacterium]MBU1483728.1 glucosaminidase domain-containing protein [Bacteroidota bacterium]MBU1759309.1 glucosaminidase domain-containing protein [Bacteroidota bacterium]MBU2268071.1 glucosaminidase domain-containing protein [Bacteroidota bacterium]